MSLSLVPMNARATVSGALLRVLGVLGVVAGVFAMHGLTADHEVAMAGMHAPAATQAAAMPAAHMSAPPLASDLFGPAQPGHAAGSKQTEHAAGPTRAGHAPGSTQVGHAAGSTLVGHAAGAMQVELVPDAAVPQSTHQVALPIALVDGFERVVIAPAGERHGMVGACLAVLSGLLLLLALALGLRSLLAWRPVVLLAPAQRLALSERSPPWLAPSLSKLCVLRT
jgi:hypothetical protein